MAGLVSKSNEIVVDEYAIAKQEMAIEVAGPDDSSPEPINAYVCRTLEGIDSPNISMHFVNVFSI